MGKKYGIKVISNSSGIKPHTLRIWEHRYKVFNPGRDENGQRVYDEEDLKKAKLLSVLTSSGHTISKLASLSLEQLKQLMPEEEGTDGGAPAASSLEVKKLLNYLNEYEIEYVAQDLNHLCSKMGVDEFIFVIILPILRKVGELVEQGKYSVTQEHIISTLIRGQLAQIYLPSEGKGKVALATAEGNLHELPIMIADILCRSHKISTFYLGAAHPAESLAQALNALKTPILLLGVVSSDHWDYKKNILDYLIRLDDVLKYRINLVLGGAEAITFPHFDNISDIQFIENLWDFNQLLKNGQL